MEINPNISGKDSTMSSGSIGSEGSTSSTDDSEVEAGVNISERSSPYDSDRESHYVSFKDIFPTMRQVYDAEIKDPSKRDQKLYERYVEIGTIHSQDSEAKNGETGDMKPIRKKVSPGIDLFPISGFRLDSSFGTQPPPVSLQAKEIYTAYVRRGQYGAGPPMDADLAMYKKYVSNKYM